MDANTYEEYRKFRIEATKHTNDDLAEVFQKRFEEIFADKLIKELASAPPPQEPIFEQKPY
jgi:hypothetical protein